MIALVVIVVFMLVAAAVAMTRRNLIHAALLLTLNWAGIAAFYLWAGVEFVAFAQMLVYVGAVSMIVLFAVLLTRRSREDEAAAERAGAATQRRAGAALVVAGAVLGVLAGAVVSTDFAGGPATPPAVSVRAIGEHLMGPQVAALLVAGALLTVALLGAVVLAAADKGEDEP